MPLAIWVCTQLKKEGMLSQHRVFFRKVSIPMLKLIWKELDSSGECGENIVEIPAFSRCIVAQS